MVNNRIMTASHPVRQAALVLARLDRDSRDAVLHRMPESQAQQIRDALVALEGADHPEQDAAIRRFLAMQNLAPASLTELGRADFEPNNVSLTSERTNTSENLSRSICDLLDHSNQALARTIAHERASTIAALLSAIPGDRAAAILRLLGAETRTRVLGILDAGIQANPKAIEAVAEWICDHLVESSLEPTVSLRHRSALKAILDEFTADERQQMLDDLEHENPLLARRLAEETAAKSSLPGDCYC